MAGAALIAIGFVHRRAADDLSRVGMSRRRSGPARRPGSRSAVGILVVAVGAIYGLAQLAARARIALRPLTLIGQHSLVRLLDSRRARLRLREPVVARAPAALGDRGRVRGVQRPDVRRRAVRRFAPTSVCSRVKN